MTKYKMGDRVVARVTAYNLYSGRPITHVTPDTPVWVVGEFSVDHDYNIVHERTLIAPEFTDEELKAMDWDGCYALSNSSDDKWRLVLEGDWPDEVCAALAKRALLGEA